MTTLELSDRFCTFFEAFETDVLIRLPAAHCVGGGYMTGIIEVSVKYVEMFWKHRISLAEFEAAKDVVALGKSVAKQCIDSRLLLKR